MSAGKYDIKIEQRATFEREITFPVGVDLTGVTAAMQGRRTDNSTEIFFDLTTENGGIVINVIDRTLDIIMSSTDTAALDFDKGVYDLILFDVDSRDIRLLEGKVILDDGVTKDGN